MKKLILTALLALASLLPAQALEKGVCGFDSPEAMDGNTFAPSSACNAYSRSQSIYTKDQLQGLYNVTSDGITKAKISKITFLVKDETGGHIFMNGETFKTTAYIQNTELEAIPEENGKYLYTDYSQSVTGSVSVDGNTDDEWGSFTMMGGGVLKVTIDLDEPLVYEGKSLLLTWIGESEFVESSNWGDGTVGALTDHYATIYEANDNSAYTNVSGSVSSAAVHKYIPALKFTYEEEVEKLGPTATEGDLVKGHAIGTKEACDYSKPSLKLPFNPEYAKATTQSLFLQSQLTGLYSANATSETKANIYSITAFLETSNFYPNSKAPFEVEVYAINTDATTFPKENNQEVWFDFSKGVRGHVSIDCTEPGWNEIFEYYYGDYTVPVTVVFDEPFTYEGQNLVLTWVTTSPKYDIYNTAFSQQYAFMPNDGINHSAYAVNNESTTGIINDKNGYLPYLEIDYKPLTISGGEAKTVVSFTNVKYGVAKAADSKGTEANNVYAEFDIEDAANCGSYDIYQGTSKIIGTINGTHGFVNFLPMIDSKGALADQVLYAKPHTDDKNVLDGELKITVADINALFVAPEVTETVETMMYGKFDHNDKSVGLQGAAKVKVSAPAPVTAIKLGDNLLIMYKGTSSNGYNDAFEGLIPETATSWEVARDPALNNGEVSFYHNGTTATVNVVRHEPQINDLSGRITLKPTADYVCLTGATVTEDAAATASAATNAITVSRTSADNYYVRFNAETPIEFDVTMPTGAEKIVMEEDGEYLMFYTTQGATLQYRLEPTVAAQPGINALAEDAADSSYDNSHEWTTAEKGYINLNLQENKGNKVFVRTVDTKGNARLTAYREIKADGTTSGVADIEADAAAGAEYFNLQGIRVSGELTPGIYIRRQGTTATKVTVK